MKTTTTKTAATIQDVENALTLLKEAVKLDPTIETQAGKKLFAACDYIIPKDGLTKDLTHAYTNAEKWWAVNAMKGKDGCTQTNGQEMIKSHITRSDAYTRHYGKAKAKVDQWMLDKFPVNDGGDVDEAA